MFNKQLLNKIFLKDEYADDYIIFNHSDKTWVMPEANLKPAFDMYQPSSFKGKVLKAIIKSFYKNQMIVKKFGCQTEKLKISDVVAENVDELKEKNVYLAAYMGDTSSVQNNKSTLQIYNDEKIICYVKVTETDSVSETFTKEIQVLKYLEEKGIENIPKVLCDKHVGKMHIFAQSTEKTFNENVKLNFDEKHLNFVDEIVKKTAKVCKVEDTDLYNEILFLKENLYKNISDEYSDIIKRAIEIIEKESDDGGIKCSFSHGDFTPWNIYYRDNQMQAFDFEYSSYNMPAYIDIYHYLTQLSLLGYNSGVKKAISIYEKYKPMIEQKDECCDFSYICYLVHILAFYFMRTDYVKDINDINFSGERIGVLRYLLENTSQIHKD